MSSKSSTALDRALIVVAVVLTSHVVSAQNGDGGAASGNLNGSAFNNGEQAGAQGPSTSSANLSVGATVAIAVIVGIVAIAGGVTAYLFFIAKKRQWTMRETLRHSRKRVTTGLRALASPLTPHRNAFSPIRTNFSSKETSAIRGDSPAPARGFGRRNKGAEEDTYALRGRDLEKGEATIASTKPATSASRSGSGGRSQSKGPINTKRQGIKINIPANGPVKGEAPQTPMWNKFLGRT